MTGAFTSTLYIICKKKEFLDNNKLVVALQQDATEHDMICETDNGRAKYIHYKQMITPPSNRFWGRTGTL